MEFERFPQICQRVFFSLALACNVHFETLSHVPIAFALAVAANGRFMTLLLHIFTAA